MAAPAPCLSGMPAADAEIDVFAYSDYRAFLRDYYRARKAAGRGFSYRSFSRRAELKSPNYLKLVIDGDRNLSTDMAKRFASACGLQGAEQRHFIELVAHSPEREPTAPHISVRLGEAGLRSLQERMQQLQAELLELSAREPKPEQLVQISIQLLPLSRARGR